MTSSCKGCTGIATPVLDVSTSLSILISSAIFFVTIFYGCWSFMRTHWGTAAFDQLTLALRADTVSRFGSTVHALIIVPMLFWQLYLDPNTEWIAYNPTTPAWVSQYVFAISLGYFTADGLLTAWYQMPMWQIFLLHHVLAGVPYAIFLFVPSCNLGIYGLSLFLLVELSNLTMNHMGLMERFGLKSSPTYTFCLYANAAMWLWCRVHNPIKVVYVLHTYMLPKVPAGSEHCLSFSAYCAYFIVVFCCYGFFVTSGFEIIARWKKRLGFV
jgi:hypothetical protein